MPGIRAPDGDGCTVLSLATRRRLAGEVPGCISAGGIMKTRTSLLALTLSALGTCALAEGPLDSSFSNTGAVAATGVASHDTLVMGGPPAQWRGLSRAEVIEGIHEARRQGSMLPAGEAMDYPYSYKSSPPLAGAASPRTAPTEVLGGPPRDGVTFDGYRFIGGEAGYERVR